MKIDKAKSNYFDDIYQFEGRLGIPSACGLKIVEKNDKYIVIVTELIKENPGTTVTEGCDKIATQLYKESKLDDQSRFVYIEHTPNVDSRLSFYHEEFYIVNFQWNTDHFENPKWTQVEKDYIDRLLTE